VPAIRAVLPAHVHIVDSAQTTAARVSAQISSGVAGDGDRDGHRGVVRWLATDGAARFARVSGIFLGTSLQADEVEIIDL
jgi:glutamate racemase